jgi:pyroglutamyl-peptidase
MVTSMKAAGIPASISLSAGTFVCNHIFYVMQDYLKDSSISSGFMHVPLMDEQRREFPTLPTMPIRQMIAGVQISLDLLRV